jgi:hypothetical protein
MAKADSAHTTIASDLSSPTRGVVQLFHTPAGLSTKRPDVTLPPIDRSALMRRAHAIARQARPYMSSYREALAHGLRAAWGLIATAREFAMLRAQVAHRTLTTEQITASRAATRRCGSSCMPF